VLLFIVVPCLKYIAKILINIFSNGEKYMYVSAAELLTTHRDDLSKKVTQFVKDKFPYRTTEFEKCTRDVSYIIQAIESCLIEGNTQHIDFISRMFFKGKVIQLKSTDVEFIAYDFMLVEIKKLLSTEDEAFNFCVDLIDKLKSHLTNGFDDSATNGFKLKNSNRETAIKRLFYNWDEEMEIVRRMQKCQRNWDYSKEVHPEVIDYLLWHAENAPSKQHEGYYDVYWTADRKVIEECSKYTWGSTHSRNPPSTWRNTQANANLYILFVAKEPNTQLNCHADGSLKSNKGSARWENAYVSIGIAMGLVMRAAQSLGYATGCNKSHGDMNGNMFWERKLGIEEDVIEGRKQIAYGIGIGFPNEGRPRWETDDYELCIGAGNGSNLTTYNENDSEWQEHHPRTSKKFRKVKIIDIRTTDKAVDPYGNVHDIPQESSIKINTMRKRVINVREIK
jgi:nitroreductase